MYDPIKPYKKATLEAIKQTWKTPYVNVKDAIYPIVKKKFTFPEVDHTDGIGTKGFYHWKAGTLKEAVVDALAMNLNDLALVRAVPYKLQNHITLPKENKAILAILNHLASECKNYKIAITGGETSIHENSDSLDISITVSGFVRKIEKNQLRVGDILVGLKSSGLHSNGFTKVRKLFGNELKKEFTQPTKIYLETILDLAAKYKINGMMHITGGAFTKLKDIGSRVNIKIHRNHKLNPQEIFYELYDKGLSDRDMYKTFNCGIGFVLSSSRSAAKKITNENADADIIGEVVAGTGLVKIESSFSSRTITL